MSHINKMRDELKYSIWLQKLLERKVRALSTGNYGETNSDGGNPDSLGTID